jgi:pyrroline-5-carboxylate reductase
MQLNNILMIGCGNMAGAMLDGWLAGGMDPARVTVVDPHAKEPRAGVRWLDALPVQTRFDAVLLGIKPQALSDVAPTVAPLTEGAVVLSILAGVELAVLAEHFPAAAGWVRIMPNLAAALGKSPMALAAEGPDQAAQDQITALLDPLGTPEWFDEADFDSVTALAGSGPAFVYRFIDALAKAGVELGVPADKAARLALATVEGASALASASPHDPGELARRVASPGGVTQAGLDALDEGDALARLIEHTLRAATERSAAMAAEAKAKAKAKAGTSARG